MVVTWNNDNTISVLPPERVKKITGTRFAAVLGFSPYDTPFSTWCDMTRTYEKPYVDTIYTHAGIVIEPIQHKYLINNYGIDTLLTPKDVYGYNTYEKTKGDFFPELAIFGGMWDALILKDGKVDTVVEFKTTSRPQDWLTDSPLNYKLQASLYAWMLGVEKVMLVCSFLPDEIYSHPEDFQPSVNNTIIRKFNYREEFPYWGNYIEQAKDFYNNLVLKGISPQYADKDKDIISALRTTAISNETEVEKVVEQAEVIKAKIDEITKAREKELKGLEKQYKEITELLKAKLISHLNSDTDTIYTEGNKYKWEVKKSVRAEINKPQLEADGLLEKYLQNKETYTLRVKEVKHEV